MADAEAAVGSSSDGRWAWATEHGAPEQASTEQLVAWLARGELPPYTLVWKPGWGEWLPALQVAEFAPAFPGVTSGSRRVARAAPNGALAPPPVPVAHYPRLRLLARDVLAESPPTPGSDAGSAAPVLLERYAYPDLDQLQQDQVTRQVPPAAMLEAAQATARAGALVESRADRCPLAPEASGAAPRRTTALTASPGPAAAPPSCAPPSCAPPSSAPPVRTLSPLELGGPPSSNSQPPPSWVRRPRRYHQWIFAGALIVSALAVRRLSSPRAAAPVVIAALQPLAPRSPSRAAPPPPAEMTEPTGIVETTGKGAPALLRTVTTSEHQGVDRVEFEFRERVPGYRLEYVDPPVLGCVTGDVRQIAGESRLEVTFFPAAAHPEHGPPSSEVREVAPRLSLLRELEQTCDFESVVTWVLGTTSSHRYRAFELSAPPRLVVEIEPAAAGARLPSAPR